MPPLYNKLEEKFLKNKPKKIQWKPIIYATLVALPYSMAVLYLTESYWGAFATQLIMFLAAKTALFSDEET